MTYNGKKDVEVAGLWLEKKKKREEKGKEL
jgi:hypothetical protein